VRVAKKTYKSGFVGLSFGLLFHMVSFDPLLCTADRGHAAEHTAKADHGAAFTAFGVE
jgi:hypothetical protein